IESACSSGAKFQGRGQAASDLYRHCCVNHEEGPIRENGRRKHAPVFSLRQDGIYRWLQKNEGFQPRIRPAYLSESQSKYRWIACCGRRCASASEEVTVAARRVVFSTFRAPSDRYVRATAPVLTCASRDACGFEKLSRVCSPS